MRTDDGDEFTADQVVIAAGSRATVPRAIAYCGVAYHTSDTIMRLAELPEHLIIAGGLDAILRNAGVTDLLVAGVWTNMAVEHTVRDAADHGYRPILVTDATSSINADWQRAALSYALTNIAEFTTTGDVTGASPTS